MRRATSVVLPLMALSAVLSATACGQKGPLTLAPTPASLAAPAAASAPAVAPAAPAAAVAPAGTAR